MIICNHLAASIKNPIILEPMFRNIGFICVSIFFFISGWGTMYGYLKKEDYLNGFVSRKITNPIFNCDNFIFGSRNSYGFEFY